MLKKHDRVALGDHSKDFAIHFEWHKEPIQGFEQKSDMAQHVLKDQSVSCVENRVSEGTSVEAGRPVRCLL